VFPVGEGLFEFDPKNPHMEWKVRSSDGTLSLTFTPGALHSEEKNLGIVASHFIQPVGRFSGVIHLGDRELILGEVLGVTEDQDVKW